MNRKKEISLQVKEDENIVQEAIVRNRAKRENKNAKDNEQESDNRKWQWKRIRRNKK